MRPRSELGLGAPARGKFAGGKAEVVRSSEWPARRGGKRTSVAPELVPWIVLGVGLLLTVLVTVAYYRAAHERARSRFHVGVEATRSRIESRIHTYLALLLATRSGFEARGPGRLAEFQRYVRELELERRYPGIQGIGFSRRMSPEEKPKVELEMRREGHGDFRVWPAQPRSEYHAILFLEPLDRRNRAAIGYDMFSEPVRREAMSRARDTGVPAASRLVTLVQEIDAKKQPGFLIYVPIYRDESARTLAERRESLVGFIYSPFRLHDLFAGIFRGEHVEATSFDVFEAPRALLYRSMSRPANAFAPMFRERYTLDVAGVTWELDFTSLPAFEASSDVRFTPAFALVGLVASLAFFVVMRSQVRARAGAEHAEAAAELARAEAEQQRAEQVRARQEIEVLADDLKKAVRVRDEFVAVAGHELRTPLAALKLQIQGLQHQAAKGAFGADQLRLRQKLDKANNHMNRLERLVAELLDVSRITAGRLTLALEPVDLELLYKETADRLSEQIARAGCAITLHAHSPVVGHWDRVRIEQVIVNLLSNALKYGAGKPVEVTIERADDAARLTVRDHGIGISQADKARIFERFERAVPERHFGGLGLGLWITKEIVQAHGGEISVESTPGEGSTFTVELPCEGLS